MLTANVFDIQYYSTHDGPGIRTTVFLKGCYLRCQWCHNPEGLSFKSEIGFFADKCQGCGACVPVCEKKALSFNQNRPVIDREKCDACGICTDKCNNLALIQYGNIMSVEDVMKKILKDKLFYENSGGGVTVSGGEALIQSDFVRELFLMCKQNGIHTAVETSGYVKWENILNVSDVCDLFLFDIKAIDKNLHIRATSRSNELILNNVRKMSQLGLNFIVRVPVIPGFNNNLTELRKIAEFIKTLNPIPKVELLPFHRMAQQKYESLGMDYPYKDEFPPKDEEIKAFEKLF